MAESLLVCAEFAAVVREIWLSLKRLSPWFRESRRIEGALRRGTMQLNCIAQVHDSVHISDGVCARLSPDTADCIARVHNAWDHRNPAAAVAV